VDHRNDFFRQSTARLVASALAALLSRAVARAEIGAGDLDTTPPDLSDLTVVRRAKRRRPSPGRPTSSPRRWWSTGPPRLRPIDAAVRVTTTTRSFWNISPRARCTISRSGRRMRPVTSPIRRSELHDAAERRRPTPRAFGGRRASRRAQLFVADQPRVERLDRQRRRHSYKVFRDGSFWRRPPHSYANTGLAASSDLPLRGVGLRRGQ